MKIVKRVLAYFSLTLLTIVLSLILVAELAENKVIQLTLRKINQGIDADITIGNIDFSLIKDFPDAIVELNNVGIYTQTDTLAEVKRMFVSVEMYPLINSEFNITEISVEGGLANYRIDSIGHSNFDVFLVADEVPSEDTTSSQLYLNLKHLELINLFCSYQDVTNDINACLHIDNALTSVYIDSETTKAELKGVLRANNCQYPSSNLHLMDETKLDIDILYLDDDITINDVYIESDGAQLKANGEIKNDSAIYMDLRVSSSLFDLRELQKYIPDSLLRACELRYVSGVASVQADIKGLYSDSVMPRIDAWMQFRDGEVGISDYPAVNDIQFSGKFSNGELMTNASSSLIVDTLAFKVGNSHAFTRASIRNLDNIHYSLSSNLHVDLEEVKYQLPDSLVNDMSGNIWLEAKTSGVLPQQYNDQFADYVLGRTMLKVKIDDVSVVMDSVLNLQQANGHLKYHNQQFALGDFEAQLPDYKLNIKNTGVKGSYKGSVNSLNTIGIDLSGFEIETDNSRLIGKASVANLEQPVYKIDANADVVLADFLAFAPDSLIENMDGNIKAWFLSEGSVHLDSVSDNVMQALFKRSNLIADFENVKLSMPDNILKLNDLDGQLLVSNDSIRLLNINGDLSGIAFRSDSTIVANFYEGFWLNQPDTIMVDANWQLGDIDYALFESLLVDDTVTSENVGESEPARYRFSAKGKITAKSFWYGNALLENLSTLYNVSDSLYIADQIKFDAFKGSANSSVRYELGEESAEVKFHTNIYNMDINQVLYDFDDFMEYSEEVYISHEQLSGRLNATTDGSVSFINDSIDMESIKMRGNYMLEDGRLKGYDIAVEMGELYNIDELGDLHFKTIDTKMFVYKGAAYVPLTNIKSNALDISFFGMQQFDMDCEYYLRLYLKELLRRGKTNTIVKKQSKEKKAKDYDGGTKGMISIFPYYEIKNGISDMGTRGNKHKDRRTMRMRVKMQETGLKVSFNPNDFNYETGVK
ncbi:AsmA-like C-terminal region-containing protein [Carboxylicivirga marina]|uniref:AsmA-like C-terminal domain-containing protein n=1 Tax=Carboxylicivirga marina TaxID=2800988 RepID=A0ABS1HGV4_9BACT|nr:AsmA-like C-terminal region-containing protein [Carboxylicivirga marina]MBK3516523.1 hypothetical protein [Carboxylicivirga marina]